METRKREKEGWKERERQEDLITGEVINYSGGFPINFPLNLSKRKESEKK